MARFAKRVGGFPPHLCAMTSVTSQGTLGRVAQLQKVDAIMRGLSIEPLRERIPAEMLDLSGIDWVILGGESGSKSSTRHFDVAWAMELRDHCLRSGVAFFLKQLGRNPLVEGVPLALKDCHGGDWDEWPSQLRRREFPQQFHMFRQDEAVEVVGACTDEGMEKLPKGEAEDFDRLHRIVVDHSKALIEVSTALREIRERKLYRARYVTFEDYCQQEHGLSRQYVNNRIKAGRTLAEMETIVSMAGMPLPSNEAQLRELGRVQNVEQRCHHYIEVCEKVKQEGGELTAWRIREYLNGIEKSDGTGQECPRLTPKQRIKEALVVLDELECEIGSDAKATGLLIRIKKLLVA